MTRHDRSFFHMCTRLFLVLAFAALALSLPLPSQAQPTWVSTGTRAHPTGRAVIRSYLAPDEALDIAIALKLRNRDKLDEIVKTLIEPGDPSTKHWLSKAQIQINFAPSAASARAVADYLTRAGFTHVVIEPNRLLITATGTAAVVRKAFNTELAHVERDGHAGIANTKDVQVPAALGDIVLSVLGLQTVEQMHTMIVPAASVQLTGSVHGLNPTLFPVAYNAMNLPPASTIAVGIITEGVMTQTITDLHTFESQNGLPTINPTVVNAFTGITSDTSGTAEWDLDSQTIQAMAGGQVAQMVFYTAKSFSDANITKAINKAVGDNVVHVINVSLGICESYAQADGSMAADDQLFQTAIAQGQTFSVSTGDSGSKECGTATGASYPASSPYVIAVGGTTLYTDATGHYGGETVWSGTGGSPSLVEPQPRWQNGIVPGTHRGVPDIAFDADPYSGAIIVVNGSNSQYGGTSLASPLFVGSWARIQSANNATLGFPASWIYSHGAQATPAFYDVVSGSNGDYSAAAGWDYTTGYGSFDVAATALLTRSSVTVSASPATILPGQSVTLTATVTGNSPTGTIQFLVNGVPLGSPVQLVNGVATLTTSQLTATGSNAITVIYSGDANNAGSTTLTAFNETVIQPDGDINGDGVVNAMDVMVAEQIALGLIVPTPSQLAHGDVAPLFSGVPAPDGKIDAADLVVIERKAFGLVNF